MTKKLHTTREGWLVAAIVKIDAEFFKGRGNALPKKLQVSCGFAKGGHNDTIGQCWDPKVSENETTQMFVCPSQAEPIRVLDILLHEMIHASVGIEAGHRGPFRIMAKSFGLVGPMKSTVAEVGTPLYGELETIAKVLGDYPHAAMQKKPKAKANPYKWPRLKSVNSDTYTLTISAKNIEEHGVPVDPWGDEMVPVS